MNRLKNLWGLAAVLGSVAGLYAFLPLGTAVHFGGDEGYKLMTGFLMSKGFILYKQIWSDQPPVFVLLLSWGFKLFGPTALVARLIAAGFGLTLFGVFFLLVCDRLGNWPALVAVFLLLASPGVLELSVSAMQEVPTFALAMVSVLLLFRWRKRPHWTWLLASGGALGLAMQTKLNAFLIVPALLVEMLLAIRQKREPGCKKKFAVSMLIWFAGCGFIFAIITLVWGRGSFQSSYRAHFTAHVVPGLERPQDFPFQTEVLLNHAECVIAAVVGIFMVFWQKRLREFAFPMVMLVTAAGIHAIHRPWWMYYYLHLAIPIAWLAGFAVAEILNRLSKIFAKTGLNLFLPKTWQALALCTVTALAVVRSERRLESGVKDLRERTRIAADPIITKMKQYAPGTHWVYVQYGNEVYPFQAQLPMPPELALVTLKRFWSDQITEEEIVEICKRYQVEQLLLPRMHGAFWNELLQDYTPIGGNGSMVLYAANRVTTK